MNPGSTFQCFCAGLRQAESADLALLHQFRHCTGGFLYRNLRIDAMLIEQINNLDSKALEARVARAANIGRRTVCTPDAVLDSKTELGCDNRRLPRNFTE